MPDRPTIHVTNWSSRRLHGPGRALTIMARPRAWERGVGRVPWLTPADSDLRDAKAGRITLDEYRSRFEAYTGGLASRGHLDPGELAVVLYDGSGSDAVRDGDTLCCACSRADAAAGRCHRVWAAQALARAGWRVLLDGVEVSGA